VSSVYEQLEDEDWFASIPGFDGLWVTDPTIQAAEAELRDTMNEHDKPPKDENPLLDTLREEVAGGLRYTHTRANANTRKLLEIASFAYAAIDLLAEKGLLQIEELDERKKTIAERMVEKFIGQGMGISHQEKEQDKYTFEAVQIDCASRLHLCKAACCKLGFALSKQDVEEGVVKWNFARPYLLLKLRMGIVSTWTAAS
jgi:hypothetical protein